jgi:hypothetical protein
MHRPETLSGWRAAETGLAGIGVTLVGAGLGRVYVGAAAPGIVATVGLVGVVAAGTLAAFAVVRLHERSEVVYAPIAAALLVIGLVVDEFA